MKKRTGRIALVLLIAVVCGCGEPKQPVDSEREAAKKIFAEKAAAFKESATKPAKPMPDSIKPATDQGSSVKLNESEPNRSSENNPNQVVGNIAEEIVGQDMDGVEFRLSDYRGKVVVLSFWGDW